MARRGDERSPENDTMRRIPHPATLLLAAIALIATGCSVQMQDVMVPVADGGSIDLAGSIESSCGSGLPPTGEAMLASRAAEHGPLPVRPRGSRVLHGPLPTGQ